MFILAVVQGIAEWFPISSSGHLVLFSHILSFDNTLAFDVALHLGTLMAVFVYFSKDIMNILRDVLHLRFKTENGRMGMLLIIATLPAGIIGFVFRGFFETSLNDLGLLALGLSITGVLLLITSFSPVTAAKKNLTYRTALIIGLAQIASLFRGISRSGSTMCTGVLLGLDQRTAARFSFLLSIPVIIGANILTMGTEPLPARYLWAALVSFFVGLASIHVLLKVVLTSKKNLKWFGLYVLFVALVLGVYLLAQ